MELKHLKSKFVLAILLIITFSTMSCEVEVSEKVVDLYVFSGQSNAIGRNITTDTLNCHEGYNGNVQVFKSNPSNYFTQLNTDNLSSYQTLVGSNVVGLENGLLNLLHSYKGDTLALLKVTKGNTSLAQDALNDDWSTSSTGELGDLEKVGITASINSHPDILNPKFHFWIQGENDAGPNGNSGGLTWADDYELNLTNRINDLNAFYISLGKTPPIHVLIGLSSANAPLRPLYYKINDAMQSVAANIANVIYYQSTALLTSDGTHKNGADFKKEAEELFQIIKDL